VESTLPASRQGESDFYGTRLLYLDPVTLGQQDGLGDIEADALEVESSQINTRQIRAAEVCPGQFRMLQICLREIAISQIRLLEFSPIEVGLDQLDTAEIQPLQALMPQVRPGPIPARDGQPAEVGLDEGRAQQAAAFEARDEEVRAAESAVGQGAILEDGRVHPGAREVAFVEPTVLRHCFAQTGIDEPAAGKTTPPKDGLGEVPLREVCIVVFLVFPDGHNVTLKGGSAFSLALPAPVRSQRSPA
jgi:hypothetical protein